MPPSAAEPESPSTAEILRSPSPRDRSSSSRFPNLRGVRWRIDLGILPSSPSSSIEDLRRVTADSRRRYANLRRCLLVGPHFPKDGDKSPDLVMDNPLSQNPDSMWGRFFRNAELERTVDQDLSHHFSDKFDGVPFPEGNVVANSRFTVSTSSASANWVAMNEEDDHGFQGCETKVASLDELDPETKDIVLLGDAYGAEGELGIVLSERFMEHDAFCMFDALMNGSRGVVAMADYYSPSPAMGSVTGLPPVIEASSALYHVLSKVDPHLHSHLVELGVEPQYFALRWLRVLFGREFLLEDLLVIWDEIFASPNGFSIPFGENDRQISFTILTSPRGAFIVGIVVSMILHLRSLLLATENATLCLQRLLNFPENINVEKLIAKAKSLQALALDPSITFASSTVWSFEKSKPSYVRGHSMSSGAISPNTPLNSLPESYWEEKWRSLHEAEELKKGSHSDPLTSRVNGLLSRAESVPSPIKFLSDKKESRASVRRKLLEDLSQEINSKMDSTNKKDSGPSTKDGSSLSVEIDMRKDSVEDLTIESSVVEETGKAASEENSSVFSTATSPLSIANERENEFEKSSVTSKISIDDTNEEACSQTPEPKLCQAPEPHLEATTSTSTSTSTSTIIGGEKHVTGSKEQQRKPLSNRFPWFWKFGRNGDATAEKIGISEGQQRPDKVGNTMRNLGQSMLENIQVVESVFQQESLENLSNNILGSKGQATATAALKELRKISNLLSEM
ncbi:hypothetical protein QJS04_geneDACA004102 [Acorus gramineus]|uniref:Rab-GAP TBC domain-containing protein n=1 Tax=Acorus gramineus TaxID=55184 RepID=A0AAV9BJT3_ACOGR|nr:hypothetical protein QJS04_geneDACA004102 [Acorus gramineus]